MDRYPNTVRFVLMLFSFGFIAAGLLALIEAVKNGHGPLILGLLTLGALAFSLWADIAERKTKERKEKDNATELSEPD